LLVGGLTGLGWERCCVCCRLFRPCRNSIEQVIPRAGILLAFLAAGLAAQAVHQLSNAGVLNILEAPLWDSSWLLSEESWPGRVLHVLIGYMDRPSVLQGVVYAVTASAIIALSHCNQKGPALPR